MALVIEFVADDKLQIAEVTAQDKTRLTAVDPQGRTHRVSSDKLLFRHESSSARSVLEQIEALRVEVDLDLIRETLLEDGAVDGQEPESLARLFFGRDDALHSSAIYRALLSDSLYFRRRGKAFAPRSAGELAEVRRLREAEQRAAEELQGLRQGLSTQVLEPSLMSRLERWLRGQPDRPLEGVLSELSATPAQYVFERLVESGHLGRTSEFEVVKANLVPEHPEAVLAHARGLSAVQPAGEPTTSTSFSIDDPETREVDDALTVVAEGEQLRVDVDIALVAAFVAIDDPVDREAQRRAATLYLPTQRYYMLPERIGCDLASLHPGVERPVFRTSLWFDAQGAIVQRELKRCWTRVARRLDYEEADALIAGGGDETARELRLLEDLARKLRERRRAAGALLIQRPEWKVQVTDEGETIAVKRTNAHSPSRMLVGELMIAANGAAAAYAREHGVPFIYRNQPEPTQPLPPVDPEDPVALLRLRGLLSPASASLEAKPHFGLGVPLYTQVTSPLRRHADLVLQRQLLAHVEGHAPPYDSTLLLKAMTAIEATDQELRRIETAVNLRWSLEYVARQPSRKRLPARVLSEVNGGAKIVLLESGADGLLALRGSPPPLGTEVLVDIDRLNPRRGALRVSLSRAG